MVRVNIINPKSLTDQHLIAEYKEIIMLIGYVKKHPGTSLDKIPKEYNLGKGHILFFKNKLRYLKKRFDKIKKEMWKRGFKADRDISISSFSEKLKRDWHASEEDKKIIKKRLIQRVKLKPEWYSYYRKKKLLKFYVDLINNG
jgi:deoxyribonuclease (pyrimidine dimer)